jgi:hypothetical protein
MNIDELTIKEAQKKLREYEELQKIFNLQNPEQKNKVKEEINHGCCIVILDKGFMYIGELITDEKFLTILNPKNIRKYTSGKGLLWHAQNGSKDMVLDKYEGILKAPYNELKHFIPTNKELWKEN